MKITSIKSVGIAGAGTMGQGIAQVCAHSGYEVWLYDINEELILKGIKQIDRSLQALMEKGKISLEQKNSTLNRIKPKPGLQNLKADLIIEAVVENTDIKKELFSVLERVNADTCILTTNTSSIPITRIASVLNNPSRFAGLHFFNPAPVMKLVEIIRGAATSPETLTVIKQFSESLGKVCVEAKDSPGFIVNRVARHYYVEALKLVEENVADIQTIDQLMRSCGFKLGPFELMDLIGVDTNFSVTNSIYNAFSQDPKFRPSRIQQQKVDAGHHGRKSGKGFYDYQ